MNLKEKLKAALKKAGLNEGLAEIITIESEDQIEGIINQLKPTTSEEELDFNQILSSEAFSKFAIKNGFDALLKASKTLQSEHDKKVTAGIKSFKEKYFKKIDGEEDEEEDEGQKKKKNMGDEIPKLLKDLMAKVEGLEKQEKTSSKSAQVKELLSKSKLSKKLQEKWVGRVDLNSEVSFEDQIKALETEEEELRTELLGGTIPRGLPTGGGSDSKPSDAEIDDVVNSLM